MRFVPKGLILKGASCFPRFPNENESSQSLTERVSANAAAYREQGNGPWSYDNISSFLSTAYKTGNSKETLASVNQSNFDDEIRAKRHIVGGILEKFSPSDYELVEFEAPLVELDPTWHFRPTYDIVVKRADVLHCIFSNPYSNVRLSHRQENALLDLLSQPVRGYRETLKLEYFDFSKIRDRRQSRHISIDFAYSDVNMQKQVLLKFVSEARTDPNQPELI